MLHCAVDQSSVVAFDHRDAHTHDPRKRVDVHSPAGARRTITLVVHVRADLEVIDVRLQSGVLHVITASWRPRRPRRVVSRCRPS